MSDYTLDEIQISLLKKGLKFTPTPNSNFSELEKDIKEFNRRLRLKEYFFEENSDEIETDTQGPLVRNKSTWNPPSKRNRTLDICIDNLTETSKNLSSIHIKNTQDNLSKRERRALQQLQTNKHIIIKEADKGGAICIMNKEFYATKITEMLDDEQTYKQTKIKDSNILTKIKKLTNKYQHCLMKEEIDYLLDFETKSSNLYGLPKIHKSKIIQEAISLQNSEYITIPSPTDLTFRPIVAGPACPTSRLSHFLDCILKNLPQHTTSYIRDDLDFLSKINRDLPNNEDYVLLTFDVTSLYTNITHDLGLEAIKFWINKLDQHINHRFKEDFIIEALTIILENNTFFFNKKNIYTN